MRTSVLLLVCLCPLPVWAADPPFDIKAGLWDITSTVQMSGLPPVPNLDKMSPEQRARVETAMKNMAAAPSTNTTKSCITKEAELRTLSPRPAAKATTVAGSW